MKRKLDSHRVKLVLPLHVSLYEEDVVNGLLDHERHLSGLLSVIRARDQLLETVKN